MSCANFTNKTRTKGFSLVEIMVGLTLGLLTVAVIAQVFSVFENQKRITSAGSDAQENGLMALVQIEQAVRNSGAGLNNSTALNCTEIYSYYEDHGTVIVPAPDIPSSASGGLAPVLITDGGNAGSDTIRLLRSSDFLGSVPATLIDETMPAESSEFKVSSALGFVDNELVMVSQNGNCTVMQVTHVQEATAQVQHHYNGIITYNPPVPFFTTHSWPTYTAGAIFLKLGRMLMTTYSVDGNYNLQVVNGGGTMSTTSTLNKDIVSLQAQYGVSSAVGVQNVSAWVDATAGSEWAPANLDTAHVKRIKAIRVTVVARSGKKEAASVTASAPGGVDISGVPDWQNYRYRVYTTIIPLRNIIWANL